MLLCAALLLGGLVVLAAPVAASQGGAAQVACSQVMSAGTTAELNEAIECFNGSATHGITVINLTSSIVLTGPTTTISNNTPNTLLAIEGNGLTLDGAGTYTGLIVGQLTGVSVNDLTIQRGVATSPFCVTPTITKCGGGILNYGGLSVTSSTFLTNTTQLTQDEAGGAIANIGLLTVSDSTFRDNSAGVGSAIASLFQMTVNGSRFANNSSLNGTVTNVGSESSFVNDSVFTDNVSAQGGGISNGGVLTVVRTQFIRNTAFAIGGGGIAGGYSADNTVPGVLTVRDSTFTENSAPRGGGIASTGELTLAGSTFVGNVGSGGGGGLDVALNAAASEPSTAIVTNSTFTENSAPLGGGIYAGTVNLTLLNSTLSANSATTAGGNLRVSNSSNTTVINTILANSTTGGDCELNTTDGATVSIMNSLIEDTGADACGAMDGTDGNVIGVNPNLAPLADNGGETQTFALQAGSPAIGIGDSDECPATDQRGVTRAMGESCDAGSYEFFCGSVMPVASTADLNAAINCFNSGNTSRATATILFDSDITLTSPTTPVLAPELGDVLIFEGAGHILDGDTTYTGLTVFPPSVVFVNDLTIQHAVATSTTCSGVALKCGGGIMNYSVLTVSASRFYTNSVSAEPDAGPPEDLREVGAGIANLGRLTVSGSHFLNNQNGQGSAIASLGPMTVSDSTFESNSPNSGTVVNAGIGSTITGSRFISNTAQLAAGINNIGDLAVVSTTFSGNTAVSDGGAILNATNPFFGGVSQLEVRASTFTNNRSMDEGGAIANTDALFVQHSTFVGNSSAEGGGAIMVYNNPPSPDATAVITNSTFSANASATQGGAIFSNGSLTLNNSTLTGNTADDTGGGIRSGNGSLTLMNTIVANSTGGDCTKGFDSTVTATTSLIEDTGADACGITTRANVIGVDPNLGPLADNGGLTQTHALMAGSPAIDAGDNDTCETLDQRYFGRTDGTCDIGAYEESGQVLAVTFRNAATASQPAIALLVATVVLLFSTVWIVRRSTSVA